MKLCGYVTNALSDMLTTVLEPAIGLPIGRAPSSLRAGRPSGEDRRPM